MTRCLLSEEARRAAHGDMLQQQRSGAGRGRDVDGGRRPVMSRSVAEADVPNGSSVSPRSSVRLLVCCALRGYLQPIERR